MVVSGPEEERQLRQLELMEHLFRRAGFRATRDELRRRWHRPICLIRTFEVHGE